LPSRFGHSGSHCSVRRRFPAGRPTVLPIYFLGGIQLLCTGIIGEYLAKIYMETKSRPRYVIEKMIGVKDGALAAANGKPGNIGNLE